MLVLGSTYENKLRKSAKSEKLRFTCNEQPSVIQDNSGRYLARFNASSVTVLIPMLELARTLFLQNIHLTRTAFRPNGLTGMTTVEELDDVGRIRFHRFSDYPLINFKSRAAQRHLIWMCFNHEARRSFGSIHQCLNACTADTWNFNFRLPSLMDWTIGIAGERLSDGSFLAKEVIGFHDPAFGYDKKVLFSHPKLKESKSIAPSNGKVPEVDPVDDDPELDMHSIPGIGRCNDVVSEPGFCFSFGGRMQPELENVAEVRSVRPRLNDVEPVREHTGVGHAQEGGTGLELDYGINRDDEAPEDFEEAEHTRRFKLFEQVVASLGEVEGFEVVRVSCHALPTPTNNSKKYKDTKNGSPVSFHLAVLRYTSTPFVIVELDTEVLTKPKPISSLVMQPCGDFKEALRTIMQACSDAGVQWPSKVLVEHSNGAERVSHPKQASSHGDHRKPLSQGDYCLAWVAILERRARKLIADITQESIRCTD